MSTKKIFYQGKAGAFSYLAGKQFFGRKGNFRGVKSFKEIFNYVLKTKNSFGVIPLENTLAGSVYENLDYLNYYNVKIYGEIILKINHHLLGIKTKIPKQKRLKIIKKVFSHPKALEQCRNFFEKYSWIEAVSFEDTAGSAEYISKKKDITLGAIASKEAARIYNLEIIKKNIEDNKENYTRFLIISKIENKKLAKKNKGSIIFYLPHLPGSLYYSLEVFALNKINLTKIESRPIIGKPFEYFFYIDFEFLKKDMNKVKDSLNKLEKRVNKLKFLGFYPKGKTFSS